MSNSAFVGGSNAETPNSNVGLELALEQHHTPEQIAELWAVSTDFPR